jgi:hypothetical protein
VNISKLALAALLATLITLPATAQVNDTYVIPAVANQQGGFGTNWMSRISIFNPHLDYKLTVSVTYVPTGGSPGIEKLIDIPANSTFWSDNVLWDVFRVSQRGGSLLLATFPEDNPGVPNNILARSFLVTSDTFNNVASGTYGQTIPGTWTGLMDIDTDGISSVAHGIMNSTQLRWRTNVGAVNLGRCEVTLRVTVYDHNGVRRLNAVPFQVPPLAHLQSPLPVQVNSGTVEFWVEDPCATDPNRYAVVFPYTSTIDEISGDPRYQSPTLLASAGSLYAKGAMVDPHAIGKKIDVNFARGIREQADRRGKAQLVSTENGWQVID